MRPRLPAPAWRRLRTDERGVAAIEFALVIPIVMFIYLVGFELGEASTVYRKLTDTTLQMANVTSQYTAMASTDMSTVMSATTQIMAPYSTSTLSGTISEVSTNASGTATITWSQPFQNGVACTGTGLTIGSAVTPPSGFDTPSTSYIMVQTTYQYSPVIGGAFIGPISMSNEIFMLPEGVEFNSVYRLEPVLRGWR